MSKVSFTVRRPTPVSRSESDSDGDFKVPALPRHLVNSRDSHSGSPLSRSVTASPQHSDSSDEEDQNQDELIVGFDQFGVQRCVHLLPSQNQPIQLTKVLDSADLSSARKTKPIAPQGPLVIPALQNRDWRELARKRRSAGQFVPPSAAAQTGADGSVGGLGVKDTINSGPALSGLQLRKKAETADDAPVTPPPDEPNTMQVEVEETEDQKALRAILSGADDTQDPNFIDIIPTPMSEADAYKQDVDELPESSTLDDYARVPVSQFGAALLRGMGWKEGTAASRKPGKGIVEPYLPAARPALLGIGAKEMEKLDNESSKDQSRRRPERRYVPVVKKDREGNIISDSEDRHRDRRRERSHSPRRSGSKAPSRRGSRSPDRRQTRDERSGQRDSDRRHDRDRDRDRDRRGDRPRDTERRRDRSGERRRNSKERRRDY